MNTQPYIVQWNANGLESRKILGELDRLISKYNPMCLCIQHVGKDDLQIKNYKIASQSQNNNGELGTAIYVHNNMTYEDLRINSQHFQCSSTTLQVPGKGKINIVNFYNQPRFRYDINELINVINSVPQPKLTLGDINRHSPLWDGRVHLPDADARKIEEMLERNNMSCMNEEESPTFFSKAHNRMTSVDIALCSDDILEEWEWHALEDTYSSDHFPIILTNLRTNDIDGGLKRYRVNCADWRNYTLYTNNIDDFDENLTSEESYAKLKEIIIKAANEYIPITTGKRRRKEVPWWSTKLQEIIDRKHKLAHMLDRKTEQIRNIQERNSNRQEDTNKIESIEKEIKALKPEYNKANALFKREANRARTESWRNYVSTLNQNTPMKKIWKRFRKVNGTNTKAPRHAIWHEGRRIHDPAEMSNIIGKHLQEISSDKSYTPKFRKHKEKQEKNKIKFNEDPHQEEYYNVKFTMEEMTAALATSNNSAPGEDNINFEMLKHLSTKSKTYLLEMYNQIWKRKEFINEWRTAIIIPIPKPGKDPSNVNNYRPVSLTSCMCKTFEKMVNARLTWYLKENNIITEMQYGSIKNRSTLDPLIQLEQHIRSGFKRKVPTIAVFYDIEKAYDTTWRHTILAKLKEANIIGQLPNFIDNFLKERTFKVRIDSHISDLYKLQNGIPQGSVLSCTLFHLAINDIIKELPSAIKKTLYMDDFAVYISAKRLSVAARILNLTNRKIEKWEEKTGFKMAEGKTKIVIFYRDKRWIKGQNVKITLNKKEIPIEDHYKFLGITFDAHLNWNRHISQTKTRCRKALKLLRKLSHTTWGADRKTLRHLYRATVLPVLDYGSQIYGSASYPKLKQLDSIHNEGARIITGAFRSTYAPSLHAEVGDLPLDLHRDLVAMKSSLRIQSSDSPAKDLFNEDDDYQIPAPFTIRSKRLLRNTTPPDTYEATEETRPHWMLKRAEICTGLMSLRKNDHPQILKNEAMQHIHSKQGYYHIYTDGSKGQTGVGYAAVTADETVKRSLPSEASIHTAELAAMSSALEIIERLGQRRYVIYSDSRSSLAAINSYNPRNQYVRQIQNKIDSIIETGKHIMICWVPAHVGLPGNEAADKAAKEATGEERGNVPLPITDLYPSLKEKQYKKWQNRWNMEPPRNKLRQVKKEVQPWKNMRTDRRTEVIMARLRLGHTRITHCHLMENPNGPEPMCVGCQTKLTVQHMMIDCPLVAPQRRATIGTGPLSKILGHETNTGKIIQYLKNIKVYEVI